MSVPGSDVRLRLGPTVRRVLDQVRLRARLALGLRGAASVILLLVAVSLLSFGLDRLLRLAWGSRAVILVIMLTMLGAVAWARLLRPLLAALPDDELARLIEGRHPALEWRLLSAVQFADPAWSPGPETSRSLAAAIVDDAERLAPGVEAARVVPGEPMLQATVRGGAVLLAGALLVVGFPEAAGTWAWRNVLLSTTARWPQDTHLIVEVAGLDSSTRAAVVPHGSDLTISVRADGVVPARVYVETWGEAQGAEAGEAPRDELLVLDGLGEGRFRAVLDEVTSGFSFVVRGGDAEEGPYRVRVIRRPWVEALTFRVTPPPHTGLPERTFGVEAGSLTLPVGTRVRLDARVSKPLAQVTLEERPAGSSDDVALVRTSTLTGSGFSAELELERTAVFKVDVVDADGLGFAQPLRFGLVAEPDEAPDVQLALHGVGLNVTPQAMVRARVGVSDDHGVVSARLRLKVGALGERPELERETTLPALAGQRAAEAEAGADLSELDLQPKMSLTLWAEATDADPRGPNVGSSPAVQLRVVTPEQLLGELLRRLHEQRLELERMILEEERLAQGLSGDDHATLERAPRAHRDVGRAVLRAADVVEGVVAEMKSNRLLDAATWDRLSGEVAAPLHALHTGPLQEARTAAEKAASAPEAERATASLAAGLGAATVAQELKAIVARMGRIEELAELVAALKAVIQKQRDLLDKTREQRGGPRRPR